jgi:DNA repair protein RecO (recombination protein O)
VAGQTTLAFVLRTQDYRDTSLLGTFYTRDFGKLKAVVKGGREARLRYGSTLEPFSLNEIIVYHRRRGDLHLVTSAELVDRYEPVRRDLEALGIAAYVGELVDEMTDSGEAHPEIFMLLKDSFEALAAKAAPRRVARVAEVKLMQYLGLMPELRHCVRCGDETDNDAYFSISSGGVVCAACRKGEGPLIAAPRKVLDALDDIRERGFGSISELQGGDEDHVERLLRRFVDYHLAYPSKSLKFLEKLEQGMMN